MIHIHLKEMIVNISVQKDDGRFENYASEEAEAWNLRILQSFVIFLAEMMILV